MSIGSQRWSFHLLLLFERTAPCFTASLPDAAPSATPTGAVLPASAWRAGARRQRAQRRCAARAARGKRETRHRTRLRAATLRLRRAAPQAQRHPSRPRVHPARTGARSAAFLQNHSRSPLPAPLRTPLEPRPRWRLAGRAMIFTGGGSFYLSDAALLDSPSRGDGVSAEVEFKLRVYGAELVQAGAILLRLCVGIARAIAGVLRTGETGETNPTASGACAGRRR